MPILQPRHELFVGTPRLSSTAADPENKKAWTGKLLKKGQGFTGTWRTGSGDRAFIITKNGSRILALDCTPYVMNEAA